MMAESIHDILKRSAGRPKSTGPGTGVLVKMHDPQLDAIDAWIAKLCEQRDRVWNSMKCANALSASLRVPLWRD
jgi:hypothetical protein